MPQPQPSRPPGAIGVTAPIAGFGTAPLGKPAVSRAGAVAALEEAREQGLIRFVKFIGHVRPDLLAWALRRYPCTSLNRGG